MKKLLGMAAAVGLAVALSGCVTNEKVAVTQVGDENLSCAQITAQNQKLDGVSEEARHNKGVNTANVAAVLFFWPAAVGNYMDSKDAEDLVQKRKARLAELYKAKGCN